MWYITSVDILAFSLFLSGALILYVWEYIDLNSCSDILVRNKGSIISNKPDTKIAKEKLEYIISRNHHAMSLSLLLTIFVVLQASLN